MHRSGVTKGGVAYSYADSTKGGGFRTKGGVAYSYGPGPTISQPASRSATPQHYPSQNYPSGYCAPSEAIYHYAHDHSPPSPLAQPYAPHTQPPLQQQHAIVSLPPPPPPPSPPQYAPPQYAPPQYAPPQYAPPQYASPQYASPQYGSPQDAPLQYAPVSTLQTIHPPVYHPARGGRVSSGRVVSSQRVETTNRAEMPPQLPGARGGPSWPQGPPAPQGPPRQDAPLQYTPQQDAPPQDAPPQHTSRHDDTYDHAAVRAAAGRAAAGRAATVHTTPGTIAQVAPPPPLPVARMRIGSVSSRVVGVTLRHVNGREAAEMVSSHDRAHASGQVVAPDDLARFQQRLGLSAHQPRGHHAPISPPQQQQHHHHTPQHYTPQHYMPQHYMHHHAPLEGRVLPAALGDPHDAVSLADALAASSQHARISQQPARPLAAPEAHLLAQRCLLGPER